MIFIDNIIFYLQKSGGVSVVWKELILRLSRDRKDICYLNFKNTPDNMCCQDLSISSKSIFYVNLFILAIQRYLALKLSAINNKFIFHSSYYRYSTNSKAVNITYPSSYEGYGIPILEAQKAGCPVIAYNSSSIPEVIGTTPLLLKKMILEEIRRCFHLLEQPDEREKIRINGFENAKRFTWDRMYNQVLEIYDEALRCE